MQLNLISFGDRYIGGAAIKIVAGWKSWRKKREKFEISKVPDRILVIKMLGGGALMSAAPALLAIKG